MRNEQIGRSQISDRMHRTTSFSKRAAGVTGEGQLTVLREDFKCPECGHDKGFRNSMGKKCTKCRWRSY